MKTHIETVMGHFGDKIYAWDVVNEAIQTNSDTGDGNARLRPSVFLNEIGDDYIDLAFHMARDYADANGWTDMKLYYNDYSIDAQNDKSDFAHTMIEGMVARGVPIDGVGFQMHIGTPNNIPTAQHVIDNMDFYIGLGLEVLISEMDINICDGKVTLDQQLNLYHDITAACVERPQCVAITFWGVNDENSWLNGFACNGANSQSLLFSNNQPKETYTRVLNALTGQ
jgi:endo-1,4-beta-xylanase